MTVATTDNRAQHQQNGSGTVTEWPFTFPVYDETHLKVYVGDTLKTLTTHYTVTLAADQEASPGGTVTMAGVAADAYVTIVREVPYTQETALANQGPWNADTIEERLDLIVMQTQQLQEALGRAVKFMKTSAFKDVDLPEPVAEKLLRWNAAADGLENIGVADLSAYVVSPLAESLLDDTTVSAFLGTLYFSTLAKTLSQITGGTAYLQELGVTAFGLSLLDDSGSSEARTTLGLGTSATKNVGTSAGNVVEVQLYGALPALDAGVLTNVAPRGWISGLQMSNAADADHDITIAAGVAADSAGGGVITLSSAITKQIDAVWAAGTNAGGLDTGTVANSTWYHVWLVKKTDGTVDALFSTSATAPVMPTGYTLKRRIGSVKTDGSANIIGFVQNGDGFLWKDPPVDVFSNGTVTVTVTSSAALKTLSVPTGVTVNALLNAFFIGADAGVIEYVYLSCPSVNDEAPSATQPPLYTVAEPFSGGYGNNLSFYITTNTSAQIRARSTGNGYLTVVTLGWVDDRGKN